MQVHHTIATVVEGNLLEVLGAAAPAQPPTLKELIDVMEKLAFVAETVAHLHGLERSILPHADAARAMVARLNPVP